MFRLIVYLAVLGVGAYLVESAPMAQPFKVAIQFVCLICAAVLILNAFGIVDVPMPRLR